MEFNIQKICWHYSNLRPLWSEVNRSKGAEVDKKFAENKIKEIRKLIFDE